ncbi:hypothetical protein V8C35DRAFT_120035 [Trichoderma chlorosporum]
MQSLLRLAKPQGAGAGPSISPASICSPMDQLEPLRVQYNSNSRHAIQRTDYNRQIRRCPSQHRHQHQHQHQRRGLCLCLCLCQLHVMRLHLDTGHWTLLGLLVYIYKRPMMLSCTAQSSLHSRPLSAHLASSSSSSSSSSSPPPCPMLLPPSLFVRSRLFPCRGPRIPEPRPRIRNKPVLGNEKKKKKPFYCTLKSLHKPPAPSLI